MAPLPYRISLLALLVLGTACPDDPPSTTGSTGSSSSGTDSSTTGPGTTSTSSTSGSTSATGDGSTGSSTSGVDSTGSDSTTTDGSDSSESSGSTTGPMPDVGCADGEREALLDDMMYPDIAACAGGWSIPGVLTGTPFCNNMGGDDGPLPTGMGCAIDDLCAPGWHLCESAMEVANAGVNDCDRLGWDGSFFATAQSGDGNDTCAAVGTNDVFGCGEIGFTIINGCAPLNRSTGNLCADLPDPWECDVQDSSEAEFLVKEAPELGGALCCRD